MVLPITSDQRMKEDGVFRTSVPDDARSASWHVQVNHVEHCEVDTAITE